MSEIVFSGKESDKTISTIIKFWGTFTPQDRIELDDINNLKTYKDNLAILSNWLLVERRFRYFFVSKIGCKRF